MAASLAAAPPWPRMHTGQKNPFQNAPGPFVYALPNLAGTCPFSFSDTVLSCPFADSASQHHHHDCYHHPAMTSCCYQQTPTTTESAVLAVAVPAPPPTPLDESHFDLGDISLSALTGGGGAEFYIRKQQQERTTSEPPTPTHSQTLSSPMGSEFPEGKDENEKEEGDGDGEEGGKGKRGRRCRRRRKRNNKGRLSSEHGGGCVMGPRVMGLSGLHFDRWTRYVCPAPAPPPPQPAAMNPAWFVAGYNDGFATPRNSTPAYPTMVQAVQGFVGVPYW